MNEPKNKPEGGDRTSAASLPHIFRDSALQECKLPYHQQGTLHQIEMQIMLRAVTNDDLLSIVTQIDKPREMIDEALRHTRYFTQSEHRAELMSFLRRAQLSERDLITIWPLTTDAVKTLEPHLREIVDCLASGWTTREIAEELNKPLQSVTNDIYSIMNILDVRTPAQIGAVGLVHHKREEIARRAAQPDAPGSRRG